MALSKLDSVEIDITKWACHPEANDFEQLQKLPTPELVRQAELGMCRREFETAIRKARKAGLRIICKLSIAY